MSQFKNLYFVLRFQFWYLIVRIVTVYFQILRKTNPSKDVLFLESFTKDGAGYTYRVKHWEELFREKGLSVESLFVTEDAATFFKSVNSEELPNYIIHCIKVRLRQICYARQFKMVIVRRNLVVYNQYGNHFMEKLLKAANSNCFLDFDDDIGEQEPTVKRSLFHRLMQTVPNQFYGSFAFYKGFICGSSYLNERLQTFHATTNVVVIPTCVHYTDELPKKKDRNNETVVFGWIGGNQNLYLLEDIIPALNEIAKSYSIELLIIAGVDSYPFQANFPVVFEQFSLEREQELMRRMDIGLMPLQDDLVSKGKCGFKLLQYMGLGIPGVASAVTVNNEIISHQENGWLVPVDGNWVTVLEDVMHSKDAYELMGQKAWETVDKSYSFKGNLERYLAFISQQINGNRD